MRPSPPSRAIRAVNVTCQRATARRSTSRTSTSQRANSEGSLTEGLKNRWLTERTSTATSASPTAPSADPNPVMLRIIGKRLSYVLTITLSIPELPPHAIELRLSRHEKSGYRLVRKADEIPELIGQYRAQQAELESEVEDPRIRHGHDCRHAITANRKEGPRPVFMAE